MKKIAWSEFRKAQVCREGRAIIISIEKFYEQVHKLGSFY